MHNYIINSYIINPGRQSVNSIANYITARYDNKTTLNDIMPEIRRLCRGDILSLVGSTDYVLTENGKYILADIKKIYARRIVEYLRKCVIRNHTKKQALKEIREEQQKLRDYLVKNKPQCCILCSRKLPLCLLETAHLIPRCLLKPDERDNTNLVEFMCRYCHTLYDSGLLGVDVNGQLVVSNKLLIGGYDINYQSGALIHSFTSNNSEYFTKHMRIIFNS